MSARELMANHILKALEGMRPSYFIFVSKRKNIKQPSEEAGEAEEERIFLEGDHLFGGGVMRAVSISEYGIDTKKKTSAINLSTFGLFIKKAATRG